MKKYRFSLLLVAILPFVLYFTGVLKPLFKHEMPDRFKLSLIRSGNQPIHVIEHEFETWSENSSGRTSSGIRTEEIFIDADKRKVYRDTNFLPNNYISLYCSCFFELNENKELQLKELSSKKIIYNSENLKRWIKNYKGPVFDYKIKDSIWTLKFNDGSETSFNENEIPEIKSCQRNSPDSKWHTKPSSGDRKFLVYNNNNNNSGKDFLNLRILRDLEGNPIVSGNADANCLIQYQKEMQGKYFLSMVDASGTIKWDLPTADFTKKSKNYYVAQTAEDIVVFTIDEIFYYDKQSCKLNGSIQLLGGGLLPNWVFWLISVSWFVVFMVLWDTLK